MGQSFPPRHVVLVVEDHALLRMMAINLMKASGFDVVEAENADVALEILTTRTDIRIVFTDVDMPGSIDGLKLAAIIRDRWPPIKILIVSGAPAAGGVRYAASQRILR